MPKRFILKSLGSQNTESISRRLEGNLLNLSAIGIKWNSSLIKQMRGIGAEESALNDGIGNNTVINDDIEFRRHSNIAGQNDFIAFYDQSYQMRRDFLRKFALQGEIDYVLETIADETIINDDMHYFAYPATKRLKSILNKDNGKDIVDGINNAYRRIYHLFHFNEGNDAWHYVKKFLVDGFLAFEIIYATSADGKRATDIVGFQELDPVTLQPDIKKDEKGNEVKVWIQNKGDSNNERILLDTNVIYISWARNNFISHLSYCERLIRSFNMLRTLENSRIIWNVQNAQKRIKIVVPVGTQSEQKVRTRLRQLEAQYKEDINIDNMSGEITVNGQPKFSFAKNFIFPSKEGTQTEISEMGVEGHDLNSTEQLKWFWQRFMIETRLPKDRFNMIFDGNEVSAIPDNSTMTREEYKFSLFINRIRDIFKEILIKPTWNQFCLRHPDFAKSNIIKNSLGLEFVEENVFALAKEKAILEQGTGIVSTLAGLQNPDQTPVFSMRFLLQKYLSFSDDDWALNEKMLEEEKKKAEEQGQGAAPGGDMGGGMDMGGDMGGGLPGADMGGGDMGADMGTDMGAGPGELPQAEPPNLENGGGFGEEPMQ
jgi:hypothetical protein